MTDYLTLPELNGELALIRRRRAEIAALVHPSQCRSEYVKLAKREAEILGEIEFRYTVGAEFRKRVFQPEEGGEKSVTG